MFIYFWYKWFFWTFFQYEYFLSVSIFFQAKILYLQRIMIFSHTFMWLKYFLFWIQRDVLCNNGHSYALMILLSAMEITLWWYRELLYYHASNNFVILFYLFFCYFLRRKNNSGFWIAYLMFLQLFGSNG